MSRTFKFLIWAALALCIVIPIAIAATSPFLAYRSLAYILAGFGGIFALGFMLIQPLLAAGYLPGLNILRAKRWHKIMGTGILIAVIIHIGGLYITSPPDTLDALLLVSPTPFSVYGVIALWGLVLTVLLVVFRTKLKIKPGLWRLIHNGLAIIVVLSTIVHALMIEGTMGNISKIVLCAAVAIASVITIVHLRIIKPAAKKRALQDQSFK